MLNKLTRPIILTAILALSSHTLLAETLTHKEAGVQITHPDDWKIESGEGEVLTAVDPSDSVRAIYRVTAFKDENISESVKDAIVELSADTQDIKMSEKVSEFTQNGMKGVEIDGTGQYDGKPVALKLVVLETPNKKALVATYDIYQSDIARLEPIVEKVWKSITPVK